MRLVRSRLKVRSASLLAALLLVGATAGAQPVASEEPDAAGNDHRPGHPRPADALFQENARERDRDDDTRLADRCDRRCRRALECSEHECVGAECGEAGDDGCRVCLGPERGQPLPSADRGCVRNRRRHHRQLEVGDRRRVADAVLVDQRVSGDTAADREAEGDAAALQAALEATDEHDPTGDEGDACRLLPRSRGA